MNRDFNPEDIILDEEEQWIEDHSEEYVPVENQAEKRKSLQEAASQPPKIIYEQLANKKMVTLRLAENDIHALKQEAIKQGLPYQSLVASVLHKYLSGSLVDIDEARKLLGI